MKMFFNSLLCILAALLLLGANAAPLSPSSTAPVPSISPVVPPVEPLNLRCITKACIDRGRAEAKTSSPTSNAPGKYFDHVTQILLENTDFKSALQDPSFQFIASQGILLTNYHGTVHPSQGNYADIVGGSPNGVKDGTFTRIKSTTKTIVDLLAEKEISWGEYQEGMPYSGFQGDYPNPENKRNMYVRKHNPLTIYDSVSNNEQRRSQMKNETLFFQDLKNDKLPQWSFITPNMTNDGHDSSVRVAGRYLDRFLVPLLQDPHFMKNSLVLITFDESEHYFPENKNLVWGVILGDAIPEGSRGTVDDTRYGHESILKMVEMNWGLGNLGKADVKATPFRVFVPKED